jgi:hypothetical protein
MTAHYWRSFWQDKYRWIVLVLAGTCLAPVISSKADQFGNLIYQNSGTAITIVGYTGPSGSVVIPDTIVGLPVTSIADYAFNYLPTLTSIVFPNSLTRIGAASFAGCVELGPVNIPSTVTNIGSVAFAYCSSLTAISVDPGNPNYSSLAGVLFDKLQKTLITYPGGKAGSYTPPNGVITIGDDSFDGSVALTNVSLPTGVSKIGLFAFADCTALISVFVPSSVTNITLSFFGCTALNSIVVDPLSTNYSSVDGVLFDKIGALLIQYPLGKVGDYTAPIGVTDIGDSAFYGCPSLTGITLPGVARIQGAAFQYCDALTEMNLYNSLTNIGSQAFLGTGLTGATIPTSVTTIGDQAFAFTSLTTAVVPEGITQLGTRMFRSCDNLTTVVLPQSVTNIGDYIFKDVSENDIAAVTGVYFKGNAPSVVGSAAFRGANHATVYYLAGTKGWTATFAGRPTAVWAAPTYNQWAQNYNLAGLFPGAGGPQDDADQDGLSNFQEMEAGTDPTLSGSVLRMETGPLPTDLSASDQKAFGPDLFALYFRSIPGKIYEIQGVSALGSQWKSIITVTPTATQKRVLVGKPAGNAFYRVSVVL